PIGLLWGELDRLIGGPLACLPAWGRFDPFASLQADFGRSPLGSPTSSGPSGRSPALAGYALTAGLVVLALGATNAMNIGRYFGQQQTEARTWSEMNGG